ncbi:MAG: hypothetical protein AAGE59_26620 [Cyanobacteria bacterium P01_F01_bin.86]
MKRTAGVSGGGAWCDALKDEKDGWGFGWGVVGRIVTGGVF